MRHQGDPAAIAPSTMEKSASMRATFLQFLRFGVVGVAGFLVDAGVLTAMLWLGLGPYAGRVVSYLAAASTTFALNRAWTFRSALREGPVAAQWGRFVLLNLMGFAANYGTYAALVAGTGIVAAYPVIGVAAGSVAGMFLNFGLSRRYVFRS
jgi:putative flippase GtrA